MKSHSVVRVIGLSLLSSSHKIAANPLLNVSRISFPRLFRYRSRGATIWIIDVTPLLSSLMQMRELSNNFINEIFIYYLIWHTGENRKFNIFNVHLKYSKFTLYVKPLAETDIDFWDSPSTHSRSSQPLFHPSEQRHRAISRRGVWFGFQSRVDRERGGGP